MGHKEHRGAAPSRVRCFVATLSDTRTEENDESGAFIRAALEAAGHETVGHCILKDDYDAIVKLLDEGIPASAQAALFNGGTGLSRRDCAYDAIQARLDKEIRGFGELFRALSYQEIGAAAMMSRATAGLMGGRVIVSMPGSTNAVRLAMERLVLPELAHMVYEAEKQA